MKIKGFVIHYVIRWYVVLGFTLVSFTCFGQQEIYGLMYTDNSPVRITIQDGIITGIRKQNRLPKGTPELIIAPGLIDNQVNGFAGVSFCSPDHVLTAQGVRDATYALWKTGVTTYLPTLTTNDPELIKKNLIVLAHMKDEKNLLGSIPGFHMEGPYISPIDGYRGTNSLEYIRKPEWDKFLEIYEYSMRSILQVTLAPELEGAMDFIDKCRSRGVVVGLGHHNASPVVISEAVTHGARIATHLGKGLADAVEAHHNPLWPQLSDDRLMISMTCDQFSLTPEEIRVFFRVKGSGNTVITSDVTGFATLPPGEYVSPEGDRIMLTDNGMLRYLNGRVYGSASPLKDGVANIMRVTGCTLAEAITMASTNPAVLYGLSDRGVIEEGKRADLILFRMVKSEMVIEKTYVLGNLVYDAVSGEW